MNSIQFVYFDVGGVLLLDYSGTQKWTEMKRDLGITPDLEGKFDAVWQKYRTKICIDCDVDTLSPEFQKATQLQIPKQYSMLEDFTNRFERNPSIWPIAQKASEKYQVGLLTNMYPRMLPLLQKKQLIPDISWNAVVDSSTAGFQKPEDEIFEIAEKKAKVPADEIFFVDNSPENVAAAMQRGWQTMLYDPQNPVESSKELARLLGL